MSADRRLPIQRQLVVFGYDFPHGKTTQGLLWLASSGINPRLVVLAPWRELKVPRLAHPSSVPNLRHPEPQAVCKALGLNYLVAAHDSETSLLAIEQLDKPFGLILGSRILKQKTIDATSGILNLHPGLLPQNRGLETVLNAIVRDLPQAVSGHLISAEIDRGVLLETEFVPVLEGDSVRDIDARVTSYEFEMAVRLVKLALVGSLPAGSNLAEGNYNHPLDAQGLAFATGKLSAYVNNYRELLDGYQD